MAPVMHALLTSSKSAAFGRDPDEHFSDVLNGTLEGETNQHTPRWHCWCAGVWEVGPVAEDFVKSKEQAR